MLVLSGAKSLLARHILPVVRDNYKVVAFDDDKGAIDDADFIHQLLDESNPSIFINCTEFSLVEDCELYREKAYSINGFAPGILADICAERDILLIHFSTPAVFSGEKDASYSESDTPQPYNVFGDSKLLGEKKIEQSGCRHLIIRVPDVYGRKDSFVHAFFRDMKNGKSIEVIQNHRKNPTYADDVAHVLQMLLNKNAEGLVHMANPGDCTIYEFYKKAHELYKKLDMNHVDFNVQEIPFEEFITPVDYPLNSLLEPARLKDEFSFTPDTWDRALERFMTQHAQELSV